MKRALRYLSDREIRPQRFRPRFAFGFAALALLVIILFVACDPIGCEDPRISDSQRCFQSSRSESDRDNEQQVPIIPTSCSRIAREAGSTGNDQLEHRMVNSSTAWFYTSSKTLGQLYDTFDCFYNLDIVEREPYTRICNAEGTVTSYDRTLYTSVGITSGPPEEEAAAKTIHIFQYERVANIPRQCSPDNRDRIVYDVLVLESAKRVTETGTVIDFRYSLSEYVTDSICLISGDLILMNYSNRWRAFSEWNREIARCSLETVMNSDGEFRTVSNYPHSESEASTEEAEDENDK